MCAMADDARPDPLGRPFPTVQDLLRADPRPQPWQLDAAPYYDIGLGGVPPTQYTGKDVLAAEYSRLWPRVWQMACREDEIPEVGDHILYEIGDRSLIVVRSAADEVRALYNVCLHRGRQLRDCPGRVAKFRCPFHGFTWALDGQLQETPTPWDFPHVTDGSFRLPEARVGRWGGFVFVNFDQAAPPLETYLEDIPSIFERWPMEARYTAAHVARPIACNWKLAVEAFVESFHVTDTHPQAASYIGDFNTQYDVWAGKRHYSRMISPRGIASPSMGEMTQDEILQSSEPNGESLRVPEGETARRAMADRRRAVLATVIGAEEAERVTDSEAIDTIQYWIFPNLVVWWGLAAPIVYRFRPLGNDPGLCLMEAYLLPLVPKDKPRPKPAKTTHLDIEQSWTDAKELGGLGAVFDQDVSNLWAVHKGLKSMRGGATTLARYQENRIRHFHDVLRGYLDRDA